MSNFSRRNFLGKLIAIPAGLWLTNYSASSASARNQIKITAIKAMQLDFQSDGCLLKIETDAGLTGYGEAGVNAKIARTHLEHITKFTRIIGGDPLSIDLHFLDFICLRMNHGGGNRYQIAST